MVGGEEKYEAIAVDASSIGRQFHEASDDLLVPFLFFSTTHFCTEREKEKSSLVR